MSKKSRTKPIMLKGSDVANMVDAVFIGAQDDPGWVEMYADAKGRECVNALFPKAHIAWADDCGEMLPRCDGDLVASRNHPRRKSRRGDPRRFGLFARHGRTSPRRALCGLAWRSPRYLRPACRRQQLAAVLKLSAADRDTAACRPPSLVHPAGAGRRA